MLSGARVVPGGSMIKAVFDTNVLISAFLSRDNPGGVSNELLRSVISGAVALQISADIVNEITQVLLRSRRAQRRYGYSRDDVDQYRAALIILASVIDDPAPTPGAVPRDPDDDKIVACAVAAGAEYLVTRDDDLLSLGSYGGIAIVAPEDFLHLVRGQTSRL